MRFHSLVLLSAFAITSSSVEADGFDVSFYGQRPTFPPGSKLTIVAGVKPGEPVVFDATKSPQIVLRPVVQGEKSSDAQPIYIFEWRKDKSARFYPIYPATLLTDLSAKNANDTANTEGKEYEQNSLQHFLQQGKVLQTCLTTNNIFRESLTFYIVVTANGKLEKAVVLPEGSAAECILEQTKETVFDSPPGRHPFTAKANIRVVE